MEDSVQGVHAGKAARMVVVAITTTRDRKDLEMADMIIDSLKELTADDFINLSCSGEGLRRDELKVRTQQGPIPNQSV